jgi:hypothetical protein
MPSKLFFFFMLWFFCFLFCGLKNDTIISRIDLSNASETDLEHLSKACQPATFGVNKEAVLDESYRKAGQMDATNFATKFVVADSGLMDVVRSDLLKGLESNKSIKAELYKLNVYGEGRYYLCGRLLVSHIFQAKAPFSNRIRTHLAAAPCLDH